MSAPWQEIASAPRDGTAFLALNSDGEMHVAKYCEDNRLARRSHQQRWSHTFASENGCQYLTGETFHFDTGWTLWSRGYVFEPTHWMALPEPPA